MVTIKDIAREAGVSVSTVSRALNNHHDVSEETKKRIQAVIEAENFVPNNNAQKLKQQVTTNIAIIIKGTFNTMFASIIEHMQERITYYGYHSESYYTDENSNEVKYALKVIHIHKPFAIIFLGGDVENFRTQFSKIEIPSVLITNSASSLGFSNLSSVSIDNVHGAYSAAECLVKNGHQKIGIIGGKLEKSFTSQLRYEGYLECFKDYGVSFDKSIQYITARYSYDSAYTAMDLLINNCPDITAVLTMSDVMAIGAIRLLKDKGKSVPDDVSVMGFDGIELAQFFNPRITTIKQSHDKLANKGVDILVSCIRNTSNAVHQVIPFKLISGESVKRI
jgi:LacI family transcriptional regulator